MGKAETGYGQPLSPEAGRPLFVERYSTLLFEGHEQNWWVAQDSRGVVFVANWTGVLEFDGTSWRMHRIPNQFVRSLAVGPDHRVYVGGVGELGMLVPDDHGTYRYESLMSHLREDERTFADIWTTYVGEDGIYFQSFRQIFRWDGREMRVWPSDTRFHKGFVARGTFYTTYEGVGLMRVTGDTLELVEGGEVFADERIDALLPFHEGGLLLATRSQGAVVMRHGRLERLSREIDLYLQGERVYQGTVVTDSTFAMSTFSGTVLLFDDLGRVVQVLGDDVGLSRDDLVLHVASDQQGGLWLALDRGLMRVDAPAATQVFDQESGLRGRVNDLARQNWSLYTATTQGLYELVPAASGREHSSKRAHFRNVGGITQAVWSIRSVSGRLIIAADDGVYDVASDRLTKILNGRALVLKSSSHDSSIVYAGLKEGMAVLRWDGRQWEVLGRAAVGEVRSIVEAEDGSVWLGTFANGVLNVAMNGGEALRITRFDEVHGIGTSVAGVVDLHDEIAVMSASGRFFRIDHSTGSTHFLPHEELNQLAGAAEFSTHFLINPQQPGKIWFIRDGQISLFERDVEGAMVDRTPAALRFRGLTAEFVHEVDEGQVWVATLQGLVRYDPSVKKPYDAPYAALVRRVTSKGDTLFGGTMHPEFRQPEIAFARNGVRFEFAAPTFNRPQETQFQYWLEGFDDGWSEWSDATVKEYTNLPERSYRFHVRALNAQGVVSDVGTFAFRVLPPWYRTWWAYTLYVLAGGVVVWGYGRWRLREHAAEFARERDVRQRIEIANARLKKANERLHLADKLKDDLLANTSHELRTPLTSILGFAAVLEEELRGEHRDFAAHIQRGGQRLLDTVNALLDMARFQADVITFDPDDIDVVQEVATSVETLEHQALQKGLFLRVSPEGMSIPARIDAGALERIVTNLVSNAIKFTNQGGVTILVDADADDVFLSVKDTGIGIRKEFLPYLFTAFSQASTGYARTHEGNGLGLAITHRLVRVLDGEIEVDSSEGGGSVFRVRLPRWATTDEDAPASDAAGSTILAGRRVLLVEDHDASVQLQAILGPKVTLDVAANLDEAILLARECVYDLVFVSGHYDGGAAEAALAVLRIAPGTSEARFVAVTPFTLPGDREHFKAMGFDEHVGRPITRNRLLLTLDVLLSRSTEVEGEWPEAGDPVI